MVLFTICLLQIFNLLFPIISPITYSCFNAHITCPLWFIVLTHLFERLSLIVIFLLVFRSKSWYDGTSLFWLSIPLKRRWPSYTDELCIMHYLKPLCSNSQRGETRRLLLDPTRCSSTGRKIPNSKLNWPPRAVSHGLLV